MACVFVVELVLLTIGVTFLSCALLSNSKYPSSVLLYENTTAILGDLQTFSTQKVTIEQDAIYSEGLHVIQIHTHDQGCSRLPFYYQKSTHNLTSYSLPKAVNLFLLEGSSLTYNICAVTNSTEVARKHIDFYIFDNLDEVINFDPNKNEHHGFNKHKDIHFALVDNLSNHHTVDSAWKCTLIPINANKDGYYSTAAFLPPGENIRIDDILVWHEVVYSYKKIDTEKLSMHCPGSQVHDSTQPCSILVPSNRHLPLEYKCIVADIGSVCSPSVSQAYDEDSDRQQFTQVAITEIPWITGLFVFYSIAAVAFILFTVILFIAIIYYRKYRLLTRPHPESLSLL